MKRTIFRMAPALALAATVIISSVVSSRTGGGVWAMAGPALGALGVIAADVLKGLTAGDRLRPSSDALFLSATLLAVAGFVGLENPAEMTSLIPVLTGGVGVVILTRDDMRRACVITPNGAESGK